MKILVLGVGRVGRAIVADLARDGEYEVTAADASPDALRAADALGARQAIEADFGEPSEIRELAAAHDLVVGAVPGPIGFRTLEWIVESRTNVVDISFFEEDPFELDGLAKENGVTALVDCGVAPGLSNMLLGFASATSDRVDRFACYVGGLPEDRSGLFQYKAPFSPIDVIAEYTRPARYVEAGEVKVDEALSQIEQIEFEGIGVLEAFLTDGLRTLVNTVPVADMCEKTMRYPGHAEQMKLLKGMGLFDSEPLEVGGVSLRPCDLTAQLLFPLWQFSPGEPDLTVMRVEIDATSDGTRRHSVYDLVDRYDAATETQSMARTTGYTCTAMVELVAKGQFTRKGICPPEFVGQEAACFEAAIEYLNHRGVRLRESVSGT